MKPILQTISTAPESTLLIQTIHREQFSARWHYHPEYELVYIIKGSGTRFVGDHIDLFSSGDLVLLGRHLPHCWASADNAPTTDVSYVVIQFGSNCLSKAFMHLPDMQHATRFLQSSRRGYQITGKCYDNIKKYVLEIATAKGIKRLILLLQIMETLMSQATLTPLASEQYHMPMNDHQSDRMAMICNYLRDHLCEPITQPEIAKIAGMTSTSFSRFFKQITGKTFTTFLTTLRINEVCKQLREQTDRPITDIAFACGFDSLSTFNRQFQSIKKIPPRNYRTLGKSIDHG
jgi:AraC-like DNA-binding protein